MVEQPEAVEDARRMRPGIGPHGRRRFGRRARRRPRPGWPAPRGRGRPSHSRGSRATAPRPTTRSWAARLVRRCRSGARTPTAPGARRSVRPPPPPGSSPRRPRSPHPHAASIHPTARSRPAGRRRGSARRRGRCARRSRRRAQRRGAPRRARAGAAPPRGLGRSCRDGTATEPTSRSGRPRACHPPARSPPAAHRGRRALALPGARRGRHTPCPAGTPPCRRARRGLRPAPGPGRPRCRLALRRSPRRQPAPRPLVDPRGVIVASRRPDPPLDIVLVVAAAAGCAFLLRPRQRRICLGDTSTELPRAPTSEPSLRSRWHRLGG